LHGANEERQEIDLVRIAIRSDEHPTARDDDARHLTNALRHVGEKHDAELRAGDIEARVIQLQRMTVHDSGSDVEPFAARSRCQQFQHSGGLIDGQDLCAEASSRDAERAAAGGHVEKTRARAHVGAA
jgi:hypothetical protein